EALQRLRGPPLHLVESRARDRVGAAEAPLGLLDEVEHERVHRQVALLGDAPEDPRVLDVVEVAVRRADVEERVAAQPERLVDLEVEDEVRHVTSSRYTSRTRPAGRSQPRRWISSRPSSVSCSTSAG